jgi:hypothetical protein
MTRIWSFGVASVAALLLSSALAQEGSQGTASVPDFSGVWGNPYLYGIEPPLSGPGPVVNKSRRLPTGAVTRGLLPSWRFTIYGRERGSARGQMQKLLAEV